MIENNTIATKNLLGRFFFTNMFYRHRNAIVIYPLLTVLAGLILLWFNPKMFYVAHCIMVSAVVFSLFIVTFNTWAIHMAVRSFRVEKQVVKMDFSEDFIHVGGVDKGKTVEYKFIKECVEFRTFFIIYFVTGSPIMVAKHGFLNDDVRNFKQLMKRKLKRERA